MADTDPKPSSPKPVKPSASKPAAPKAEKNVGGAETRSVAAAKTGVKADTASVKSITNAFNALTTAVKLARAEFKGLIQDASKASKAMAGATGAVSGSYIPSATSTSQGAANSGTASGSKKGTTYIPSATSTSEGAANNPNKADKATPTSAGSGGNGIKGGVPPLAAINPFAAIAGLISSVVGSGIGAMDKRIDENMAYSLPADRLSMVQQQMTGQTQQQVHQQSRSPLSNYKLGEGGINAALANQVRYGINAKSQAAGYEALRTVSGFSLSTQDLIGMQNQMMSAPVANRMFAMTGGTNFNKMGGGAADMFTTFQKLGKISGLDNAKILKGAAQQGSAVRSNLSNMGLTGEAQDLLIQYAQENQTYKSKGGKGQYNPQDKASRKLMGVEDNYANQSESTKATQVRREERMYADQASSYAKLEKSNQQLIDALSDLDHTMKDLYKKRIETRPQQKAAGSILSTLGNIASGAGMVAMFVPGGQAIGAGLLAAGAVTANVGGALQGSGDGITSSTSSTPNVAIAATPATAPASQVASNVTSSASSANDDSITVPVGPKFQQKSITYVKNLPTFQMLKPIMQDRLLKIFRENPRVGILEGFRSNENQKKLFLSRYRRSDKKTETSMSYDGSNWEKIDPSLADAAPPGKSMHELGLAADLEGDLGWLVSNASRFGLKTFANENKEPWHVQPLEYPSDRFSLERGLKNGTINSLSEAPSASTDPTVTGAGSTATSPNGYASPGAKSGHNVSLFDGLSGQQIVDIMGARRPGANSSYLGRGVKPPVGANTLSKVGAPSGSPIETSPDATLTPEQIAQVAYNAGFRGQDLTNMVAIGLRESHGHVNSVNLKGGDDSHGLWQINFKPHAQGPFMESLGYSRSSMYDPNVAAKAAFAIYKKNHNSLQAAWLTGKDHALTDPGIVKEMPKAIAAINATGLAPRGDPVPRSSGGGGGSTITPSGGGTMHFNSSPTITMPMNFTFQGVPGDVDIKKIAAQVRTAIKSELDLELMRTR